MHHTVLSGTNPKYWVSGSSFTDTLRDATVFFGLTHGATTGIYDTDNVLRLWSVIRSHAHTAKAGVTPNVPGHNVALVYGCETLGSNPRAGPHSFNLVQFDGSVLHNRGYAGFEKPVSAMLPNMTDSLSDHSNMVMDRLKAGDNLSAALGKANAKYMPVFATFQGGEPYYEDLPMVVAGDGAARLVNVYVSQVERSKLTTVQYNALTWYWVR